MKLPIKLLVVDDDLEFRRYLTPLLDGKGYRVLEAATGLEGLQLARESRPDLVLLDAVLPDLSGLVICQQIKADPLLAATFVVLVSKEAVSWEDRSAGLSVGADEYLAKPIAPRDFLAWVQAMVRPQQAEKKLHASERRFRALAERASDAIALLNEAGAFLYLSPSTTHILGYVANDLLGRNAFELVHPDDLPLTLSTFNRLRENPGGSESSGVRYRHKNGSWRWLDGVATNLLGEPSVRGIVINCRDVTERKRIEEALQASKARLDGIVSLAMDAIISIDASHRIILFNAAAEQMFQYPAREVLGQPIDRLIPDRFRAQHRSHLEEFGRANVSSRRLGTLGMITGLRANGEEFPIEASISQTKVTGEKIYTVILRDITERVSAEDRLRFQATILSNVRESIIVTDRQGRVLYWNDEATRIFGYAAAEMLGKTSLLLYPEQNEETFAVHLEASLRGQDHAGEWRGRRKDGTDVWMDVRTTPMRDAHGQVIGIVGVSADVTERRETQAKLNDYAARLQLLSRRLIEAQETERRSIAREIHDEIGQVILAAEMNLQSALHLAQGTEVVPLIQESIVILDRVLRQAHDLALDLRPTMLDDLGLVPALRWYTNQQAQRAGLRVEFFADSWPARLDPTIDTVCYRVGQEAVTNVVRHAKAQALSVQLLREADQLHLIVYDDGIGFDVKATRKSAWANAKLGLLGMEERISLAGGRIEFKSAPGQGTEIHAWLSLPGSAQPQTRFSR